MEKRNGKGKEYNEKFSVDNLIYKGEYLNGKRNGKGKEYNVCDSIMCLEYLNGKKWNGAFYNERENIFYEIKNGKGYMCEFVHRKYLRYEGEFLNGKLNWKGKEFKGDKLIFEGEYINGKRNGKGKEYYNNGQILFEGEYLYDYRFKGMEYSNDKLSDSKETFFDELRDFFTHGGRGNIKGYLQYEGEYLCNKKWSGKGYKYETLKYELNNGKGTIQEFSNEGKLIFEGEYLNGKRNGKGKEYNSYDRIKFEGEYLNGKGKEYNRYNRIGFEGEYSDGKRNGKGKEYNLDGILIFEGEYLNNERYNGKGKEFYYDKKIEYEGEYLNGKHYNGKYYYDTGKIEYEVNNIQKKIEIYKYNGAIDYEGGFLNGKKTEKEKIIIIMV